MRLALELKATAVGPRQNPQASVRSQPFGGAVRIADLDRFHAAVGDFTFDSERSQAECDLRVYIEPQRLPVFHRFCLEGEGQGLQPEGDLTRELQEEFEDCLGLVPSLNEFSITRVGLFWEGLPAPTRNDRAPGVPTVRFYWVYEAQVRSPALCQSLLASSDANPPAALRRLAIEDYQRGGSGRKNSVFLASQDDLREIYLSLPQAERASRLPFREAVLESNVPVILQGVDSPLFQPLP